MRRLRSSPRIQALATHDIEVLLVPSMTEANQGACRVRDAARTRASEHCAYVAVARTTGDPAPDWQHFGRGAVLASQEGPFHGLDAEVPEMGPGLVLVATAKRLMFDSTVLGRDYQLVVTSADLHGSAQFTVGSEPGPPVVVPLR